MSLVDFVAQVNFCVHDPTRFFLLTLFTYMMKAVLSLFNVTSLIISTIHAIPNHRLLQLEFDLSCLKYILSSASSY